MPAGIPLFCSMRFTRLQHLLLWCAALTSFGLALWIVIYAGLPRAADYDLVTIDGELFSAPAVHNPAPPLTASTLTNDTVSLADLRGQWVIINFWATWCGPCLIEMPELQTLHDDSTIDVRVLAINIGESRPAIEAWVAELGLTFTIIPDPQGILYARYRVRGQPSTYVVSPDGIIQRIYYGATSAETLRSVIDASLPQTDG